MIIDGREMASEVLVRAKTRAKLLGHVPRILAIATKTLRTLLAFSGT